MAIGYVECVMEPRPSLLELAVDHNTYLTLLGGLLSWDVRAEGGSSVTRSNDRSLAGWVGGGVTLSPALSQTAATRAVARGGGVRGRRGLGRRRRSRWPGRW